MGGSLFLCFVSVCIGLVQENNGLESMTELDDVMDGLKRAIAEKPSIKFSIRCWHVKQYTVVEKDKDGKERTVVKTRDVVTHRATEDYPINEWLDVSPPLKTLDALTVL